MISSRRPSPAVGAVEGAVVEPLAEELLTTGVASNLRQGEASGELLGAVSGAAEVEPGALSVDEETSQEAL